MQFVAPDGMWLAGRPVAVVPLWQLAQLVAAVNVLWFTRAPAQPLVLWQLSQAVTPAWIGVFGLPTAGGKLPLWQLAHWLVTDTLAWKRAGAQAAKPPRWQLSQLVMATPLSVWYGMWVVGLPSAGGNAPLWQVEHWLVTVTCVWLKRVGRQPVTLWQEMQLVAPDGMWLAGRPAAEVPLWQLAQLVAVVNPLWSTRAPAQPDVLWQLSQAVTLAWIGVLGLPTAGGKLPLWQVAHWLLTDTAVWKRAGAQAAKPLRWQVSQFVIATPLKLW
jgi:hypothetical protein